MHDALQKLFSRRTHGIKLGLDMERAILKRLGNPERRLAVVHVAGTNGKGSVCAIMESVLRAGGLRTGLYTSPHLVQFNERFRLDGAPVADVVLEGLVARVEGAADGAAEALGYDATFFEMSTALAFLYFAEAGVQIAIIETGMGGRLDATNVVEPLLSVITRIGLEHTEHLGPDLASIAPEKAGIIKSGRPVVCGAMPEEARGIVRAAAREHGSRFVDAVEHASVQVKQRELSGQKVVVETEAARYGTVWFALAGTHQIENLATAVTSLEVLVDLIGIPLQPDALVRGLQRVEWPGRMQLLEEDPPMVLDGAHNPDAARNLARALQDMAGNRPVALVLGVCGDKDLDGILEQLGRLATRAWAVPLNSDRALDPEDLAARLRQKVGDVVCCDLPIAVRQARDWAKAQRGLVCVTGSLFLVGEMLALHDSNGEGTHEKEED